MGKFGQHALIQYEGRLEDGTVVDDNLDEAPLDIILGSAQVFPILERSIMEMNPGEEITLEVASDDAYGPYREEAVRKTPLYSMPNWRDINVGEMLEINSFRNNSTSRVVVKKIEGSSVYLDYNHPLAGHDLTYWVKLVDVHN